MKQDETLAIQRQLIVISNLCRRFKIRVTTYNGSQRALQGVKKFSSTIMAQTFIDGYTNL